MDILIKGLEMPKGGYRTVEIAFDADGHPMALADGGDVFDVIPVPPHGRLGDLNLLAERLEDLRKTTAKENPPTDNHGFNNGIMCGIGAAINEVRYYTPTIIPASNESRLLS